MTLEIGRCTHIVANKPGVPFRRRSTVWWCSKTIFSFQSLFKLPKTSFKFMCTPALLGALHNFLLDFIFSVKKYPRTGISLCVFWYFPRRDKLEKDLAFLQCKMLILLFYINGPRWIIIKKLHKIFTAIRYQRKV